MMQPEERTRGTSLIRVLLVDDELALGLTLARAMGDSYEMVLETSMKGAVRRLEQDSNFDAILCDVNMPEGSGVALFEEVARHWPTLRDRVIFITGGIFDESISRFLATVPNACLEKPFDLSSLERALRSKRQDPANE